MFAVGVGVSVLVFPCDDFHGTKPQNMNPLVNRRFLHVGTGPVMIHDDIMIIVVKRIHVYNIILISTEKKALSNQFSLMLFVVFFLSFLTLKKEHLLLNSSFMVVGNQHLDASLPPTQKARTERNLNHLGRGDCGSAETAGWLVIGRSLVQIPAPG